MKISLCLMAVFAVCCCVASMSVDPSSDSTAFDGSEYKSDDTRTKRSGEIVQALLSKKLNLFSSLSGSSAGKSLGAPDPSYGAQQIPLSFHTKSFSLWGVKKAILASVFQAAKAITGGVLALKGQLMKAKGHVVQAKGKLLQTKGEAITNLGKTVATHAFDSGVQQYDDQLAYAQPQLPVQTNYGGYQGVQAFPQTAYAAPRPISYPTTYGGQGEYSNDAGYVNQGYTNKRAVSNPLIGSSNQVQNAFDKNGMQAGLLILKPIRLPQNGQNNGNQAQAFNQRAQANNFAPQAFGFQAPKPNPALSSAFGGPDTRFPIQGNSYLTQSIQNPIAGQQPLVNNEIQNLAYPLGNPINGQAFGQQLGGFPGPAFPQPQENFGDQFHSASDSQEHAVEPLREHFFRDDMPFKKDMSKKKPEKLTSSFFTPTVSTTDEDEFLEENESNVRSVVHEREVSTSAQETNIVPLQYPNDSSPEDQARLKKTVQRFFNMLQSKQYVS